MLCVLRLRPLTRAVLPGLSRAHGRLLGREVVALLAHLLLLGRLKLLQALHQAGELQQKLAAGQVDVVIGTHQLLGKDVTFHDLGLVVVDEEQRFGVRQKEKIKGVITGLDLVTNVLETYGENNKLGIQSGKVWVDGDSTALTPGVAHCSGTVMQPSAL